MISTRMLNKMYEWMEEVEKEWGKFTLFGLFLREHSDNKWDLVVSAPKLEKGKLKALGSFMEKAKPFLDDEELLSLSRIVTLNKNEEALNKLLGGIKEKMTWQKPLKEATWKIFFLPEHLGLEFQGENLFGLPIKHAYIMRPEPPVAERIKANAKHVTEELSERMGFSQNLFEPRGGGIYQKEAGSPIWILHFWFRGDMGADVEISVTEDPPDKSIRREITAGLEREVQRLGYGDRL